MNRSADACADYSATFSYIFTIKLSLY